MSRTQLAVVAARERSILSPIGPGGGTDVVADHRADVADHREDIDHREDLERVFRAEYVRVVTIAQRVLGDRDVAEDVAQEVFLGFARSRVEGAAAGRWLAVAAVHTALNSVRSDRRRNGRELRVQSDPALGRPESGGDPADDAVRSLERARVRRALAGLPRNQAVALVLRHSGASYADIADALGIATSGVGTTVRRAEAALRKELTSVDPSF